MNLDTLESKDTQQRYLRSNFEYMVQPCRRAANKKCDELSSNVSSSALAEFALAKNISDTVAHYISISNAISANMNDYNGIKMISQVASEVFDNEHEVEIYMTGFADAITNLYPRIDTLKSHASWYAKQLHSKKELALKLNTLIRGTGSGVKIFSLEENLKQLDEISAQYGKPLINLSKKTWLQKLIEYVIYGKLITRNK